MVAALALRALQVLLFHVRARVRHRVVSRDAVLVRVPVQVGRLSALALRVASFVCLSRTRGAGHLAAARTAAQIAAARLARLGEQLHPDHLEPRRAALRRAADEDAAGLHDPHDVRRAPLRRVQGPGSRERAVVRLPLGLRHAERAGEQAG